MKEPLLTTALGTILNLALAKSFSTIKFRWDFVPQNDFPGPLDISFLVGNLK